MKYIAILFVTIIYLSCTDNNEDWKYLFLENNNDWIKTGEAHWAFENNVLIGSQGSGSGFVITKENFSDFHLKAEFYPDSNVNSGIFIRCKNDEISLVSCYEINIWDDHVNPDFRTGAVVTLAKPLAYVETVEQWNTYEIKAEGDHLQAWVNGIQTADLRDTTFRNGTVALQLSEKGEIKFRNVRIKAL